MKSITVEFSKGIQFPARLGTLGLRRTAGGKLAYAQNINFLNDAYGVGAITPGPRLINIAGVDQLTGVPFAKSFYGSSSADVGYLYFLQGLLGVRNIIRRIRDITVTGTPAVDTDGVMTVDHSGHSNPVLTDIQIRSDASNNFYIYVSGKDDTDTWVYKFLANSLNPTLSLVATNPDFASGLTDQFLVLGSDNNLYWIGQRRVSSIGTSDGYVVNALLNGLPLGTYASAGVDWNNFLVVAYSTDAFGSFDRRHAAGSSGVILWDYDNANLIKKIPAPCRYISALVTDPSGNLLAFGGLDEGKSSIYELGGYGFSLVTNYIGDLPRSRHSIEFDGQGRILWQTNNGQWCRYDRSNGVFEHLNALTELANSAGGFLAKGLGLSLGSDFFLGSGEGSTYTIKKVQNGSFTGDDNIDGINTPLAVSGLEYLPDSTTISAITWRITRPLQSGEKVQLLVYENGNTTPILYSTLEFAVDGPVSSKREVKTLININNYSLGVVWHMTDGNNTAPAVLPAEVEPF